MVSLNAFYVFVRVRNCADLNYDVKKCPMLVQNIIDAIVKLNILKTQGKSRGFCLVSLSLSFSSLSITLSDARHVELVDEIVANTRAGAAKRESIAFIAVAARQRGYAEVVVGQRGYP